jgi:leader peptidase (prepilin peptidase) / N-methyltransferase
VSGAVLGAVIAFLLAPVTSVLTTRPPLRDAEEQPSGRFRCDSCGSRVRPDDAVPVLSYLRLRGKCRTCGAAINRWDLAAEVLSLAVGALVGWRVGMHRELPAFLLLGLVSVVVVLVDARLHKIATKMIYPAAAAGFALLAVAGLTTGRSDAVLRALLGGLAASAFIWLLVIIYPAGMGDGDARLVLFLGLYLGWFGWRYVYIGMMAGFLLGSVCGIVLMVVKKTGRKTQIAFGPYLCAGAMFVALWPGLFTTYLQ